MTKTQTAKWMDQCPDDFDRWGWWLLGATLLFAFWCWRTFYAED